MGCLGVRKMSGNPRQPDCQSPEVVYSGEPE